MKLSYRWQSAKRFLSKLYTLNTSQQQPYRTDRKTRRHSYTSYRP